MWFAPVVSGTSHNFVFGFKNLLKTALQHHFHTETKPVERVAFEPVKPVKPVVEKKDFYTKDFLSDSRVAGIWNEKVGDLRLCCLYPSSSPGLPGLFKCHVTH